MRTSRYLPSILVATVLLLAAVTAFADDKSLPSSSGGVVSDQKAGSILFFNVYTSSSINAVSENTQITVTNTSPNKSVTVHLFFVDGASCTPVDYSICMSPNLTFKFTTAEFDPGTTGYIMMVAVDANGCPIVHNFLVGDEFVKFASGHQANLAAEGVAAKEAPDCDELSGIAVLNFDGTQYDRLPSTVAIDNIPSVADGNSTMVFLNRPSGDFILGADTIGQVYALLYDDQERAHSFGFSATTCQFKLVFTATTPRIAPRFGTVVPQGHTGWVRLLTSREIPLLGAVFNYNPGASTSATAFTGGYNLHKLGTTTSKITIPSYAASCN